MKIIAVSDLHGNLIRIRESCDLFVIAGDWSPLYCQHDCTQTLSWIDSTFIPWMKRLNAKHIVFIPGNHDIVCTLSCFKNEFDYFLKRNNCTNISYLCNSGITIFGRKIFGIPNSESPNGWAFSDQYNQTYDFDDDTDILITHQPPRFGNVGYVRQFNKEFGSVDLRNEILRSNISLNICGHIHTGDHTPTQTTLNNGNTAIIQNTSILDENYEVAYPYTVTNI